MYWLQLFPLVGSYSFHLSFSNKILECHLLAWNMTYPLEVIYLNDNQMKLY